MQTFYLSTSFIRQPHLIGVAIERSAHYVAAVIGIIRTGHAFFTLDPPGPEGLSDYALQKCRDYNVQVVVSTSEIYNLESLPTDDKELKFYFANASSLSDIPPERQLPRAKCSEEQICYAIQTSGSTGEPKIVHVPLSAILPNIIDFGKRFQINEHSRVLFSTNLFFDPSVVEMLLAIHFGAELAILPAGWQADSALFERFLNVDGAVFDFVQLTPSVLQRFRPEFLRRLFGKNSPARNLLIGGEPFPLNLIRYYRHPRCSTEIFNVYGVTEVSAWTSCHRLAFDSDGKLLGRQNPVPIGETLMSTLFSIDKNNLLWIFGRKCFVNFNFDDCPAAFKTADQADYVPDGSTSGQCHTILLSRNDKPNGVLSFAAEVENIFLQYFSRITFAKLVFVENCAYMLINYAPGKDENIDTHLRTRIQAFCESGRLSSRCNVQRIFFNIKLDDLITQNGKIHITKLEAYCRERLRSTVSAALSNCRDAWAFLTNLYGNLKAIPLNDEILSGALRTLGFGSLEIAELAFLIEDSMKEGTTYFFLDSGEYSMTVLQLLFDTNVSTLLRIIDEVFLSKHDPLQANGDRQRSGKAVRKNSQIDDELTYVAGRRQVIADEEWSRNMGKCVDASPLYISSTSSGVGGCSTGVVYIGSHAGQFRCFDARDGSEMLVFDEPNGAAIEAKCAAGRRFVAFGTLGGLFYVFERSSHKLFGRVQASGEIRASPTVLVGQCAETVAFAGYDGFLRVYHVANEATTLPSGVLLDVSASRTEFGLVRAAPFFSLADGQDEIFVVVGTLAGYVISFGITAQNRIWSVRLDGPIFADIIALSANADLKYGHSLIVATVKGTIHFLDRTNGETKVRLFLPSVAIFDAPTVVNDNDTTLLVLAYGNRLFVLGKYDLYWRRIKLDGLENFSTVRNPIVIDNRAFLLSTDGRLVSFCLKENEFDYERLLIIDEPTFGSPLVFRENQQDKAEQDPERYRILMGTRADRFRCFSVQINR